MSNAVSALNGRSANGPVTVREMGLQGMITLRGDLSDAKLKKAVKAVSGCGLPGQRGLEMSGDKGVAWMSPDELLLMVPHGEANDAVTTVEKALKDVHFMAVNVSDARAMLELQGDHVREVMARVCPVDFHPENFGPGEIRRTRLAQVAAAIWMTADDTFRVVCFRSVADYAFGVLSNAAKAEPMGLF